MKSMYNITLFQRALLASLLLFSTINCALAQEPYQVRMAMVGNSITFGSTLPNPATDNYAAQLNDMLATVYGDTVLMQNYGVSGRTMLRNSGNSIWNEIKFKNALEFVPDICLILLGTNDSRADYWDPVGDQFMDDYLSMVDTFQFRNPNTKFILCLPPPIFENEMWDHDNSTLVNEIIPLIESVASSTGATLVDFHTALTDSVHLTTDMLHPNVEGAQLMAELLFDVITDNEIIEQVETGLAFVKTFKQVPSIVPAGQNVDLQWTTIFADSVFLDGVYMDETSGSAEVIAEAGRVYTLSAKGAYNISEYPLVLNTSPPVSTQEIYQNIAVRSFPNPTKENIYLEVENLPTKSIQIKIFSVTGEQLSEQRFENINPTTSRFELDLDQLTQGVYFYGIYDRTSAIAFGQFVKQKN